MTRYSDWSTLDPRMVEVIAYSRSMEEARKAYGLPSTLPESASLSAALAETFASGAKSLNLKSQQPYGDGVTDDSGKITAALAILSALGGGILYVPKPTVSYYVPTPVTVPHNCRILGDGWFQTIFKRGPSGNAVFTFAAANYQGVLDCGFDGNAVAGAFVTFTDANSRYVELKRLFFTNYPSTSVALTIVADGAPFGQFEELFFEPTGSQNTVAAINFGNDTGPSYRSFTKCYALNGNPLVDFGGLELNWFINCGGQELLFSGTTSKKVIMVGCRWSNALTVTVKGINHNIVGVTFGNGDIVFDSSTNTCTFDSCVYTNVTDNGLNNKIGVTQMAPSVVTYSASMTISGSLPSYVTTATDGVAFTINAPTNPSSGHLLEFTIRNASGGALGAATWNAVFKMSAWSQPANGFSRSITWRYDGTNWVEKSRTPADVPN